MREGRMREVVATALVVALLAGCGDDGPGHDPSNYDVGWFRYLL